MLRNLALPLLAVSAARAAAELPTGWRVFDECAIDSANRVIKSFKQTRSSSNTPASCIASCSSQGYAYAGVEYGVECESFQVKGCPDFDNIQAIAERPSTKTWNLLRYPSAIWSVARLEQAVAALTP